MTNCSHACRSKDHATFGECMRSKGLQIGDLGRGVAANTDRRLNAYAGARAVGLQPKSTKLKDSVATMRRAGA